jgi:hypothetical protein
LPIRRNGQDVVAQIGSGLGHATTAARGADAPFAGEADEVLALAGSALQAGESMRDYAAAQIALELGAHVSRIAEAVLTAGNGLGEHRLHMLAHHAV